MQRYHFILGKFVVTLAISYEEDFIDKL